MNVRIQSAQAKATYLSVGLIIVVAASVMLAVPAGTPPGIVAYIALSTAWIIIGVRTFRGDGEPIRPPRAWWRMTNKPTAGFVIAALLLVHAVATATQLGQDSTGVLGFSIVFDVVVAGFYLHSSMKLKTRKNSER